MDGMKKTFLFTHYGIFSALNAAHASTDLIMLTRNGGLL